MKIRIKGNSIRFRLTKTDMDLFSEKGYVEDRVQFGTGIFVYAIKTSDETSMGASLGNNLITLSMPAAMAKEWVDTQKVGFEARIPLPNQGELHLLAEKDFKCLDDTIEDQSDNYDNPLLANK